MKQIGIQISTVDLLETLEHYEKAFGATVIYKGYADDENEKDLIHLEIDIMGGRLAIAPFAPHEIIKGNHIVLSVDFDNEATLRNAYNILKENGQAEELESFPWTPLGAYVTDRFGVKWWLSL